MLVLRKVSLYNLFGVSSLPTSKNSSTPFEEAPSPLKENLTHSPVLKSFLGLGSIGIKKIYYYAQNNNVIKSIRKKIESKKLKFHHKKMHKCLLNLHIPGYTRTFQALNLVMLHHKIPPYFERLLARTSYHYSHW